MYKFIAASALAILLSGTAWVAAQGTTSGDTELAANDSVNTSQEEDNEGDTTARFHGDAESCPMPDGVTLEGNWNHGAYVGAWAKSDSEQKTSVFAKSDCGKPVDSAGEDEDEDEESEDQNLEDDDEDEEESEEDDIDAQNGNGKGKGRH